MADTEDSAAGLSQRDVPMVGSVELYWRYLLTRNLDDLNQAVFRARGDLTSIPPPVPTIIHLGRTLLRRFQHTRQVEDLTEAIEKLRYALQFFVDDHDDGTLHQWCFDLLSMCYLERDGNLDGLLELNVPHPYTQSRPSLEILIENLDEPDDVFTYVARTLSGFHNPLSSQYTLEDLDTAIHICRLALGFFPHDSDRSLIILCKLSTYLVDRFQARKKVEDINEAVDCCFICLERQEPNSVTFWWWQSMTSRACVHRYTALRRREDLDNAVRLAEEAVDAIEMQYPDFPEFGFFLICLSRALLHRYDITEDVNDLNMAIYTSTRAVNFAKGLNLSRALQQFHSCLVDRFMRSRRAEDFIEMIMIYRKIVQCSSPDDPACLPALMHLVGLELEHATILEDADCAGQVSQYIRQALENRAVKQYVQLALGNQE